MNLIDITIQEVSKYRNITIEMMLSKTHKFEYRRPRQECHYLIKKIDDKINLSMIGRKVGNKDHATVLRSIKVVGQEIEVNKKYRNELIELEYIILDKLYVGVEAKIEKNKVTIDEMKQRIDLLKNQSDIIAMMTKQLSKSINYDVYKDGVIKCEKLSPEELEYFASTINVEHYSVIEHSKKGDSVMPMTDLFNSPYSKMHIT